MPVRLDRSLDEVATLLGASVEAERSASHSAWLQRCDARAKVIGAALALLTVGLARSPITLLALYIVLVAVAGVSRLPVSRLLRREWLVAAVFTGAVALPGIFERVTPGHIVLPLPGGFDISDRGVFVASRLLLRAVTSVHVVLLLTQTTPWNRVLAALRGLGVPAVAVMVLSISHRYIYLLIESLRDMLTGREARRVGRLSPGEARRQLGATVGTLLLRSQDTATAVFHAMSARGFRGDARTLSVPRWRAGDTALCLGALALCAIAFSLDRYARF